MAESAPPHPFAAPGPEAGGAGPGPGAVAGALRHQRLVRDLLPGAHEPTFHFDHLTRRPDQLGIGPAEVASLGPAPPPIGPLDAPEATDPVATPVDDDPLVPIGGRGIRVFGAYRAEGWPHALPGGHLRRSVAARLEAVAAALPVPWSLAVFDAWRPLALQAALHAAAYADPDLPPGFVAEPDPDPTRPPAHLTGGTVDLTLTHDGIPLALGTGFDDFTAAARADHLEGATPLDDRDRVVRDLRRHLVAALRAEGFVVLHCEWWHFELGTRYWAAVTGGVARFGPAQLPEPVAPRR